MAQSSSSSLAQQSSHSHSQARQKLFIQMSGAPGSGKSTTADLLALEIDPLVVPHDTVKSILLERDIPFDEAGKLTYLIDWALAEEVMKQGQSVIMDSICNYQETVNQGSRLARKYRYAYWYIEIRADPDNLALLDHRLRTRKSLKSQRRSVNAHPLHGMKVGYTSKDDQALVQFRNWVVNPCRPKGNANTIVVSAEGSIRDRIDDILKQLQVPSASAVEGW